MGQGEGQFGLQYAEVIRIRRLSPCGLTEQRVKGFPQPDRATQHPSRLKGITGLHWITCLHRITGRSLVRLVTLIRGGLGVAAPGGQGGIAVQVLTPVRCVPGVDGVHEVQAERAPDQVRHVRHPGLLTINLKFSGLHRIGRVDLTV
jgi:hypothetical protein